MRKKRRGKRRNPQDFRYGKKKFISPLSDVKKLIRRHKESLHHPIMLNLKGRNGFYWLILCHALIRFAPPATVTPDGIGYSTKS